MHESILHLTARTGNIRLAGLLLDNGAHIDGSGPRAHTPLVEAVSAGNYDMVQFLLERGADIHGDGVGWWTPAHSAVYDQRTKILELLIQHDCNVNASALCHGRARPLHLAVDNADVDAARLLLEAGADPNVIAVVRFPGHECATVLGKACLLGYAAVVDLLLEHRARFGESETWLGTPLLCHLARAADREMLEVLHKRIPDVNSRWKQYVGLIRWLFPGHG